MSGKTDSSSSNLQLPAPLRHLVGLRTEEVIEVQSITTLRSNDPRRETYLLRFASGQLLKGRTLRCREMLSRMQYVHRHMQKGTFSRIVATHGEALLEEWVTGTPLDQLALHPSLIHRCGEMLAQIHTTSAPRREWSRTNVDPVMRDIWEELRQLQIFSRAECDRLWKLAQQYRPASMEVGFVHRDFCAENLVFDGERLCSIDNVSLSIESLDQDIARTWYRWNMQPRQWETFLAGYRQHRDVGQYLAHQPFWNLLVLISAAVFRVRCEVPESAVPIRRLIEFLQHPEQAALVQKLSA